MDEKERYYVVKEKAIGEVLLKVVEAKRRLAADENMTVQKVAEKLGISRSSFYKYKDDIFPFHDNARGRIITFVMQMDDVPGLLAGILTKVAAYGANVNTIQQAVPANRIALVTLSIRVPVGEEAARDPGKTSPDIEQLFDEIRNLEGIHYLKIIARE
ncbi:MAG: ACT domain-containing protein [Lachnospiraceae bacterium]|nr:ACT domain-containing protein [Lachnospiraceae bacterium]